MKIVVTGGAGFIGSALVRRLVRDGHRVLNIDRLTYAGRLETVAEVATSPDYSYVHADVVDNDRMRALWRAFAPDAVLHLAAESHVDRSIENANEFLRTNIMGAHSILDASLSYWTDLDDAGKSAFRLVMVSTDEVYGSLGDAGLFSETSPYRPNSPYSASKAAGDHLARAWHVTYGLPAIVTHCSNNYGPWQHAEKLIPTILRKAFAGEPVPIYGQGRNVRDWIYVEDHVDGLLAVASLGRPGECYNLGGEAERSNLELAQRLCALLDLHSPRADGKPHATAITFVTDRPGHDFRYAVDISKARRELDWRPRTGLDSGLEATIKWYLENPGWLARSDDELARRGLAKRGDDRR